MSILEAIPSPVKIDFRNFLDNRDTARIEVVLEFNPLNFIRETIGAGAIGT
jgi:hypothetical protein